MNLFFKRNKIFDMVIFLLIILVCLVVLFWKGKKALLILPAFIPLYLLKFDFIVPFNVMECLIYISFVFFLLRGSFSWRKISKNSFIWPIFLFLIAVTVSLVIVPKSTLLSDGEVVDSLKVALGIWKGWIVAPILFFLLLSLLSLKKNKKDLFKVLNSLELSAFVLSLLTLHQVIFGWFLTIDQRASGPFVSANYLSLYLGPVVAMMIVRFFIDTKYLKLWKSLRLDRWSFFRLLNFLVILSAFYFSKSYAAWIALFGSMFLIMILTQLFFNQFLWKKITILFFVFFILFISQINSDKFQSWINFEERSSSSVRLEVWQVTSGLIADSPFLGIGLGQFSSQYNVNAVDILKRAPLEWIMIHPHNVFLSFWLNSGVLGLFAFLWMIFISFNLVLKKERRNDVELIALSMFFVVLIHGLFDTSVWKNDLFMQFYLILACFVK